MEEQSIEEDFLALGLGVEWQTEEEKEKIIEKWDVGQKASKSQRKA